MTITSGSSFTTPTLIADNIHAPLGSSDAISSFTLVNNVAASVALEIQSTSAALLISRLTTTQINNLVAANGMMVYDSTLNAFKIYENGTWKIVAAGASVLDSTYILQTPNASLPNAQSLSALTSGILKSATGTGVISIATAGTDYYSPGSLSGLSTGVVKVTTGTGALTTAVSGTDYYAPSSFSGLATGLLKNTTGTGAVSIATNGTDYYSPASLAGLSTGIVKVTTGTGALSTATAGTDYYSSGNPTRIIDTGSGNNFFIGTSAGNLTTTGTFNVGVGYQALKALTSGTHNTGVGYNSLAAMTSGVHNTAVGYNTLAASTDSGNTAIGWNVLSAATSGTDNTGIGDEALKACTTGEHNTAIGATALNALTTGNDNIGIGRAALLTQNKGNSIAIGNDAGAFWTDYNDCIFIGDGADANANNLTNAIAIGVGSTVNTSNSLVLGANCNVGIGTAEPVNALHVVGTYQQKGVLSGYTGTDIIKGQKSLQTTNATPGTIFLLSIPDTPHKAMFFKAQLVCLKTDASKAAYGEGFIGLRNDGTATFIGASSPVAITMTNSGSFAVAAEFLISLDIFGVNVTGIAATTINWILSYEYFTVTDSTS